MSVSSEKKNILIAEDNDITRLSLVTMFTRGGYNVFEAETVKEAYEVMNSAADLFAVIADFGFEESNGISLLIVARKKFPEAKLSIFTAHENLENRRDVSDVLGKYNLKGKIKFFYKPIEGGAFGEWLGS